MPTQLQKIIVRIISILLLSAAFLKLYGFNLSPFAEYGWLSSSFVQLLSVEWEIVLGIWLLSGVYWPLGWLAVSATFAAFACISFYLAMVGEASCGCFGTVHASPWLAFCIDIGVLSALAFIRPPIHAIVSIYSRKESRWVATNVFWAFLIFCGIASIYLVVFGSFQAALANLRGQPLSVESTYIDMGEAESSQVSQSFVRITNWSNTPIRLIGGTNDCSCDTTTGLPLTILPSETVAIPVLLRAPESHVGLFTRNAGIRTDDDSTQVIVLTLSVLVRQSQSGSK